MPHLRLTSLSMLFIALVASVQATDVIGQVKSIKSKVEAVIAPKFMNETAFSFFKNKDALVDALLGRKAPHDDTHAHTGTHLSHDALMALTPSPNVRARYDAQYNYVGGGIGILVYDGVNAMDVLGPFQVFSTAGLLPLLVSASKDLGGNPGDYKREITTNSGLTLTASRTIADTPALDVVVVTGGALETVQLAQDPDVLAWLRATDAGTHWTASVCTGAWVLGAAGLLQGRRATANWYQAAELLAHFGAKPAPEERYVFDGRLVTAAGVTAGLDMALAMVQRLFSPADLNDGRDFTQAVMLDLQYDPKPPIRGGSPATTDPYVYEGMEMMYDMVPSYYGLGSMTFAEYIESVLPSPTAPPTPTSTPTAPPTPTSTPTSTPPHTHMP